MEIEKGKLLYNFSGEEKIKKLNQNFKKRLLISGILMLFSLCLATTSILIFPTKEMSIQFDIFLNLLLLLMFLLSIYLILLACGKDFLKVYEIGIVLPQRGIRNTLIKQEEFLHFNNISKVYLHPHNPNIIIIKIKKGRRFPSQIIINNTDVYNIKEFKQLIKERLKNVNIDKWEGYHEYIGIKQPIEWDPVMLSKLKKIPIIGEKTKIEIEKRARKDGIELITEEYLNKTTPEIKIDPIDGLTILAVLLFLSSILVEVFIPIIWEVWILSSFTFMFLMIIIQLVR